ncbi:DNA gyrase inhibitor YacG [Nitrospirota bacterium]
MKIVCPICKAETTWEENPDRPFCSKRCRLMDLGKWVSQEYKVQGEGLDESEPGNGEIDE